MSGKIFLLHSLRRGSPSGFLAWKWHSYSFVLEKLIWLHVLDLEMERDWK
jgi:hypothetical protein